MPRLPGLPVNIPDRPSKRYAQVTLLVALASLGFKACELLETHDVSIGPVHIVRVESGARTSSIAPRR